MKFEVLSAYHYNDYPKQLKDYLSTYCYSNDGDLYIDDPDIETIKEMLNGIKEEWYKDTNGWKPEEVIIDFKYQTLTIKDYYIE